jgi:ABC-type transport system substrate-binding protein
MSYTINYTYIIEELLEGRAFRAYGAISPGYGAGFNRWLRDSPQTATGNGSGVYNLAIARQVIIDGLGGDARLTGLTANSDPDDAAWEAVDLNTFNYSYNNYRWLASGLYPVLEDWFDDIGIYLTDGGVNWDPWNPFSIYPIGYIPGGYDQIQLCFLSWIDPKNYLDCLDYLDPFNILDPLFSNISRSNLCQINDPWVTGNLTLALQTIDEKTRNQIYHDIQWRVFAELYAHAPIYHPVVTSVHAANLYDVEYDVWSRWWALPVKKNYTWLPAL